MEHVNGWCFRGIYKGGLWENDLHVSALNYGGYLLTCGILGIFCYKNSEVNIQMKTEARVSSNSSQQQTQSQ